MTKNQLLNLKKAHDSALWFAENLIDWNEDEIIEPYQEDVLNSITHNVKTAFRSGHGVGKTAIAAICVLWFLSTRKNSKVITTASSWRQVAKQLWPEIHKWSTRIHWERIGVTPGTDFELLTLGMKFSEEWFATGEASDEPEKMEGFHAKHLMFVIDEAKIVSPKIFESIEGAFTNAIGDIRVLAISTPPPEKAGYFWEIFSGKRIGWHKFHVSGIDSRRVSRQWIEDRKKEWGEDSPIYQNRVLGEFSDSTDDFLIPLSWVEKAIDRDLIPHLHAKSEIGVDVARFGSDKSAFVARRGPKLLDIKQTTKQDTMETTGNSINMFNEHEASVIRVDEIGVGSGVVDRLDEQEFPVEGVNVATRPTDYEEKQKTNEFSMFADLRAEIWWNVRTLFRDGLIDIFDYEDLVAQLTNVKYKFNSKGQIVIESKEDIKKRGFKSPDVADAFCLAFWQTDTFSLVDIEERINKDKDTKKRRRSSDGNVKESPVTSGIRNRTF